MSWLSLEQCQAPVLLCRRVRVDKAKRAHAVQSHENARAHGRRPLRTLQLVITPVRAPRQDWFSGYQAEQDEYAWEGLPIDADGGEWEW